MALFRTSRFWLVVMLALLVVWVYRSHVQAYNGFNVSDALVPASEIHAGGPEKDGIPAITHPSFSSSHQTHWLKPDARVLTLDWQGVQRAYPLDILNWHEVVNDQVAGKPVLITYCPLCGSGMAFSPNVAGRNLTFGVSGLLYNSDVLLYDHETRSLWSQIRAQAISGPLKGERLQSIPLSLEVWKHWRVTHPNADVLSRDTGFARDYHRNPYFQYARDKGVYFPVAFSSRRYHPKERVLGVKLGDQVKAYPFAELARLNDDQAEDLFAGELLQLRFDAKTRTGKIYDAAGNELPSVNLFWFAWYAFYPQTEVFAITPGDQ